MSNTSLSGYRAPAVPGAPVAVPRVREQARAALALMSFSLITSGGLATALVVLGHLGR